MQQPQATQPRAQPSVEARPTPQPEIKKLAREKNRLTKPLNQRSPIQLGLRKASKIKRLSDSQIRRGIGHLLEQRRIVWVFAVDDEFLIAPESAREGRCARAQRGAHLQDLLEEEGGVVLVLLVLLGGEVGGHGAGGAVACGIGE